MYAKESQHQKVVVSFYEKITLATLELLDKGIEILKELIPLGYSLTLCVFLKKKI